MAADRVAHRTADQHEAAVGVAPAGAGRRLELALRGIGGHVALDVPHARRRIPAARRLVERQAARHPQKLVDGHSGPRVSRLLPLGHRRRAIDREPALAHQHADQRVRHRLAHRVAVPRRARPDARRIALADDAAAMHHDHRVRVARRPFARLGEGGIDGGADARVGGVDRRGAGIALVGVDGRRRRQRCIGGRVAAQQQAAEPVAVHGAALEAAGDCRGDLAARAIDVVAQRPVDEPHAGFGAHLFAIRLVGVAAGQEHGRAQGVAHGTRGDPHRAPRRRVGAAGERRERGDDEQETRKDHVNAPRLERPQRARRRGGRLAGFGMR